MLQSSCNSICHLAVKSYCAKMTINDLAEGDEELRKRRGGMAVEKKGKNSEEELRKRRNRTKKQKGLSKASEVG